MVDVSISLVGLNQRKDLERLLPSLERVVDKRTETLLVDNRSNDGTAEFVGERYAWVSVQRNPNRAGYGENHNLNLARAQGRYFVIMNSDVMVEDGLFKKLREFMDQRPDVGIASPKILNEDGTIQGLNKRLPTVYDLILRRFVPKGIEWAFRKRMEYYEMRDIGYEAICDVPFVSGAFMFCRTDLIKTLNGFDTNYFLYFEDVDLCRRVQKTHRTIYYPHVAATHFWERAAHKKLIFTWYFVRSALRYFWRWGVKWH